MNNICLNMKFNEQERAGFIPLEYGIDNNFEGRNMRGYHLW